MAVDAPLDELAAEAIAFVEQGFRAVKLRIGSERPRRRRRAGAHGSIRDRTTTSVCSSTPIRSSRRNRPSGSDVGSRSIDLTWIEEPVAADDLVGHADVRAALDTPIASGETEYTRFGMQAMLDARAADVLMPDLQRIGGYTEFRRAAAAASALHIPVSSHFFTEYSLALAGSLSNCISVEHVDWFAPLFVEEIELRDGRIVIADRPGHGFTFDPDAIARYAIG